MKLGYWLTTATHFLQSRSITSARLDCLVLLEDTLKHDRTWVLAHPEYELSDAAVAHLKNLLGRRSKHEPLAYIRGRSEFYGRTFVITKDVLVPRPESETMISLLKELDVFKPPQAPKTVDRVDDYRSTLTAPKRLSIADIGTGSGALGVTAKLELPQTDVTLIELETAALKTAQLNVDKFATPITLVCSDLLLAAPTDYDILLCNLPYVPDAYEINKAARHEPAIALFAGHDGLNLYRRLFEQVINRQKRPLFILTEALLSQHAQLAQIALQNGYKLLKSDGLIQVFCPVDAQQIYT